MTIDEIIRRLEAGESGREVDAAIWWHVDRARAERTYWAAALGLPRPLTKMPDGGLGWANMRVCAPHYTTSLDAAVSLVPEGYHALINTRTNSAFVALDGIWHCPYAGTAPTPALALCIAALKARQAKPWPRTAPINACGGGL